jgi:hypothetical protein
MPVRVTWSCPYCINMLSSRHWNVQRHINTIHRSAGRRAEPIDYRSGLTREHSKVWDYLCRRSYYQQQQHPPYYQQQQEQSRLELGDQKRYANKDDPDRGFWTLFNSVNVLKLLQEIQVKTTQIAQQNQQIIALLTRLIDTI